MYMYEQNITEKNDVYLHHVFKWQSHLVKKYLF